MRVKLGLNIDHVATLREVRKSSYPDLLEAAEACRRGGADQITIHLREDRRHIQDRDLKALMKWKRLPINLEMAFCPEMVSIACRTKPFSVTLVPERRAEMTTESGLNLLTLKKKLAGLRKIQRVSRVYGFIDADFDQLLLARKMGLDGVEFHTGTFAEVFEHGSRDRLRKELDRLIEAARWAKELQLEVKAGHGLTLQNVGLILKIPYLEELNIGHSVVSRSVIVGLERATREMKVALKKRS